MNTLENLQRIKMTTKGGNPFFAERLSDTMWEVSKGTGTRKDRVTEKALAAWIRDADLRYEVTKLRPQKVTVDTSELDELNEKLMQLFVTAGMLRSMGIDLRDVASPAEPAAASDAPTPPDSVYTIKLSPDRSYIAGVTSLEQVCNYSFRAAKCNYETCRNIMLTENPDFDMIEAAKSVSILHSDIGYTRSKLTENFTEKKSGMFTFDMKNVLEACRGQRVQIEMFPKQEYYDHLAKRYGRLVEDVQESARIAEDLQKQLQNQRDRYTFLDAKRAELHEKMKRLG